MEHFEKRYVPLFIPFVVDHRFAAVALPKIASKMARARRPSSLTPMGIYDIFVPALTTLLDPCELRAVAPVGRIATASFNSRSTKIALVGRLHPSPTFMQPSTGLLADCTHIFSQV
jgi:hypothetical protein